MCSECSSAGLPSNCTACYAGNFLEVDESTNDGSCVTECKTSYYGDYDID